MNQPVRPRKLGTPRTRYPPGRTSRAWFSTIRRRSAKCSMRPSEYTTSKARKIADVGRDVRLDDVTANAEQPEVLDGLRAAGGGEVNARDAIARAAVDVGQVLAGRAADLGRGEGRIAGQPSIEDVEDRVQVVGARRVPILSRQRQRAPVAIPVLRAGQRGGGRRGIDRPRRQLIGPRMPGKLEAGLAPARARPRPTAARRRPPRAARPRPCSPPARAPSAYASTSPAGTTMPRPSASSS